MNDVEKRIRFLNYAAEGDVKGVRRMLSQGNAPAPGSLRHSAKNGYREVVETLLANAVVPEKEVASALCAAAESKRLDIVQLLLDAGASPNAGAGKLLTKPVLLIAVEQGLTQLVKQLLERGANPNAHDIPAGAGILGTNIQRTALMAAAVAGNATIVQMLLEAGADPTIKGSDNRTAYELVIKNKRRKEVAQLLLRCNSRPVTRTNPREKKAKETPQGIIRDWEAIIKLLSMLCRASPISHQKSKAIRIFKMPSPRIIASMLKRQVGVGKLTLRDYANFVALLQKQCKTAEALVFLSFIDGKAFICAAPWRDKFKLITALKTGSVNYGITTAKLVTDLRNIETMWPFTLYECAEESIGGRFLIPIKKPNKLAAALIEICPFVLEDHSNRLEKFKRSLEKAHTFRLWWS
jgi:hypothetical protein